MAGKMGVGLLVGNRGFFPGHLCQTGRQVLLKVLKEKGVPVVALSERDTKFGSVETWPDVKKCVELFQKNREMLSGIIVTLPNFGDERAVADTLRLAGLNVPVLIHAWPDDMAKMDIANRRDSFCGKISVCNNLIQYGIKFSLTGRHTIDPEDPAFAGDLDRFLGICRIVQGLKNVKFGAVGTRPAAFKTVRYSEKILENYGISVDTIDLSEILARIGKLPDKDSRVKKRVEWLRKYTDTAEISSSALVKMAKLKTVLDGWVEENSLSAIAVQCWSSIQENYGIMACAVLSMLSNSLIPAACEVDITGALAMYILQLASGSPSAIVDWNNNYRNEPDKAVVFHCSNFPAAFFEKSRMYYGEIIAGTVGKENAYGTIYGLIKALPFTYLRLTTDAKAGKIKGYAGEGEVTRDKIDTFGGCGVIRVPNLQGLLKYICENGFEHHVVMNLSRTADMVCEALAKYQGWPMYQHP